MQCVKQGAQSRECCDRSKGRAYRNSGRLGRVGHPGWESADGAVRQLTKNVLAARKLHTSLHAKTLPKQRVKRIVNLDDLGPMGIMFLSRVEPAKRIS